MLITKILENDTCNCFEAMKTDSLLVELENKFYKVAEKLPDKDELSMESIFNEYMARVIRIAYLQGMKDFVELHIVLRDNITDILDKYVD